MGILTYDNDNFLMDGNPYQIISGAIHYFRVHPDYWFDRLEKLKACGFNTVETYVCWNLHERREGSFDFSGRLDIVKFIETAKIDILVENMGRVNYGPKLLDGKGIIGGVRLGMRFHFGWQHYSLFMEALDNLNWSDINDLKVPAFFKGNLNIKDTPCDTFIKLTGFQKGFVTINGFNIGRYYNSAGPQKTLYIPAPILKEGNNEIIVFETDGCKKPIVEFCDKPELK